MAFGSNWKPKQLRTSEVAVPISEVQVGRIPGDWKQCDSLVAATRTACSCPGLCWRPCRSCCLVSLIERLWKGGEGGSVTCSRSIIRILAGHRDAGRSLARPLLCLLTEVPLVEVAHEQAFLCCRTIHALQSSRQQPPPCQHVHIFNWRQGWS